MSRFRLREIRARNYRCFEELTLPIEEDTTVLFAENGGGKTVLLTALAMGLAALDSERTRLRGPSRGGRHRRRCGPCALAGSSSAVSFLRS